MQTPKRSANVARAQRTLDPSRGRTSRRGRPFSGRTISIARCAFEEGQRFDVTHQLFKSGSIGLSGLPTDAGQSGYGLAECRGVVERGPTARTTKAEPGKRMIRLRPRLEDCLTGTNVVAGFPPADQGDHGEEDGRENDVGDKNPRPRCLVGCIRYRLTF